MKKIVFIIILFPVLLWSQAEEKETVYVLFSLNNGEKCNVEDGDGNVLSIKKFRKKMKVDRFYICDEIFRLRRKGAIDTCSIKLLKETTFKDLKYLNEQRDKLKPVNFFKNSVFEKIYFIEPHKDYVIRYEVMWVTDLIQK